MKTGHSVLLIIGRIGIFIEYNGAYNGSEKFSKENRFAFFNSGAIGWMVSEEPFMKFLKERRILDMLKIRASYGEIGDDNVKTTLVVYEPMGLRRNLVFGCRSW